VVFVLEAFAVLGQIEHPSVVSTGVSCHSTASVAASLGTPKLFSRSNRGRRHVLTNVVVSQPTLTQASLSQVNLNNQEECLVRPSPHT
jgi:hypothetical protein